MQLIFIVSLVSKYLNMEQLVLIYLCSLFFIQCRILQEDHDHYYGNGTISRHRRYLGLSRRYKLNRRYQECVGPGDIQGHCKHVIFCPVDIIGTSRNALDYLCVIAKTHVGVCCPDDIILSNLQGSRIVMDLPAGGMDYDEDDISTGCGLVTLARSDQKASIQRWPWIAVLYKLDEPHQQFCSGALITDQHILTAGHCFEGFTVNEVRVRLGEYDFTKLNETRSKDFKAEKLIIHEEFNSATYENDIAIVKLDKPTIFNTYMWPICLPPVDETFEKKIVTVAGWGQVFYGGPTSEVLLEVSMPVWEQKECVDAFAQRITENNLCAAGYEGDQDSCLGDSGGPLVYQLENGRWVTIGIVSWGIGCGQQNQPGIYIRVNKYIPWILTNTLTK